MKLLKKACGAALGILTIGFGLSACGLAPYVAKVNGTVVTRAQLFAELNAIGNDPAYVSSYAQQGITVKGKAKGSFNTTFVDQIIDQQISVILIRQADQKRKLTVTPGDLALARTDLITTVGGAKVFDAFPKSYQSYLATSTAQYTALEASLGGVTISPATVASYYSSHTPELSNVCVSVIVVATKAKADTVEAALHKGTSFATLAKADSADTQTAPSGGAVGCSIPEAFAQVYGTSVASVVQTLATGKVSAPIEVTSGTRSAYVITNVTSRTPLTMAQATPVVLGLQLNPLMSKLTAYTAAELKASKVSVDPSYGRFTIKNGLPNVLAPTVPPAADLVVPQTTTTTASTAPPATVPPAPPATTTTTAAKPKTTTTTAPGTTTTTAAKPGTTTTTAPRATTTTTKPSTAGSS